MQLKVYFSSKHNRPSRTFMCEDHAKENVAVGTIKIEILLRRRTFVDVNGEKRVDYV